jgi:hypothetical protein
MPKFDPRRDPPYFAVIQRTAPEGSNAGQFMDASEKLIGLAAAEVGFMGIEDHLPHDGVMYTACYWRDAKALKRWREDAPNHLPPTVDIEQLVCFEGCFWYWLDDVFDAKSRAVDENVVEVSFGEKAA